MRPIALVGFHPNTLAYCIFEHTPGSMSSETYVGISLAASYAVLSKRNAHGTFVEVSKVQGNAEYIGMIRRLSAREAQHASPPYDTIEELWQDCPRQMLRRLRMRLGYAASADVATLSHILRQSLTSIEKASDDAFNLKAMIIAYPALHGLTQEDIVDAATYLGIRLLSGHHIYQPRTLVSAYAGHDLGLCLNYENDQICRKEELELPIRHVLLVEYTAHALLLHASVLREAKELAKHEIEIFSDFSLGSKDTKNRDGVARIGDAVRKFVEKSYGKSNSPPCITVIMTGDAVTTDVTEVVIEVIERVGIDVEMLDTESESIAASWAAELAWRSSGRPSPEEL